MIKIKDSDIMQEIEVCPYCMSEFEGSCCGEVHSEPAIVTKDFECYLLSEVTIVEE